jgi:hypothetical protein
VTLLEFLVGISILTTAGLSDLLGQSVVLFLNRVSLQRALLCLSGGWLLFLASATLWAVGLWILGSAFHLQLGLGRAFWLVALSHAPQVLGVLVLLPHFGSYVFHGLRAWVFFNLVVAVGLATGAPLSVSVLCCLPGWMLHFSLTHLRLLRLERFL